MKKEKLIKQQKSSPKVKCEGAELENACIFSFPYLGIALTANVDQMYDSKLRINTAMIRCGKIRLYIAAVLSVQCCMHNDIRL